MTRHVALDQCTDMTLGDCAAVRPYAMVVEWSDEDRKFVVTFPDVIGCRTDGATREEAVRNGEEALAATLAALTDRDVSLPQPRFTALDDAIYAGAAVRTA